jgi:CheY-like chemotaxis protein
MMGGGDFRNAGILIVDDREANVSLLDQILTEEGYTRITTSTNPLEVRELHRKHRYDLIVLDLQMPGMDGFEVMEGLKADESEDYLPVIVLTAQPAHKLRALQAGARDFISKPFSLVDLTTRIRNMLEARLLDEQSASYSNVPMT